jgi:hypothetical protein
VVLDIDASIVEIHTESKGDGRAHLQGLVWLTSDVLLRGPDREALASVLRPGNAGANKIPRARLGWGDRPAFGADRTRPPHRRRCRSCPPPGHRGADPAGCTPGFLAACRARNMSFFVTARTSAQRALRSTTPRSSSRCGRRWSPPTVS